MSDKNGIVLNRMYTGSYLSTNLGHEVINMFQADNGRHYLYLNAKGNYSPRGREAETMLLVRGSGDNRIEVVGMAKNLHPVASACCTLSRNLAIINERVQKEQIKFMNSTGHDIRYGGVPVTDIFGERGQQSIFVSYWTDKEDFYTPRKGNTLIIEFTPSKAKSDNARTGISRKKKDSGEEIIVRMSEHNFASTSLHQFIYDGEDLRILSKVCDVNRDGKEQFWENPNNMIEFPIECNECRTSLFDICQIQNDENRFSNALSYFIDKYPELWQRFFQEYLNDDHLGRILSVTREEDAKVDDKTYLQPTGGRIDLLVRTDNSYLIIENKIDSDIIVQDEVSQLCRYYNYVSHLIREETGYWEDYIQNCQERLDARIRQYDGLSERAKENERGVKWNKEISDLSQKLQKAKLQSKHVREKRIIGLVLAPDYNMPEDDKLVVSEHVRFRKLPYSAMYEWLKIHACEEMAKDVNFRDFHSAMKRHKYSHRSISLYEEMKNRFYTRIRDFHMGDYKRNNFICPAQ